MYRYLVFGVGKFFINRKEKLRKSQIIGYLDNDSNKWGEKIDGYEITSPNLLQKYNGKYDYILIMSLAEEAMKKQLNALGVSEEKVITYDQFQRANEGTNCLIWYGERYNFQEKNIVLFSHASDLSGAPLALVYFARQLKKMGKRPIIVCQYNGLLSEAIKDEGIAMLITEDISVNNFVIGSLISNSELVVVNTLVLYKIIKELNGLTVPVLWWLHETELEYNKLVQRNIKPFELKSNIHPYGVGRVAQNEFFNFFGKKIESLLYALPDFYEESNITFAVIGLVTIRKGQDIYIKAVERLSQEIRQKARFLIIGDYNREEEEFCQRIFDKISIIPEIDYLGVLSRKEIESKMKEIDVIVMPSRKDPMPIALVEGFMNRKVCISSDATAVSDFIKDQVNGMIFQSENIEELANKMKKIIESPNIIKEIGLQGRKIYEQYFSEKKMQDNILNILERLYSNE